MPRGYDTRFHPQRSVDRSRFNPYLNVGWDNPDDDEEYDPDMGYARTDTAQYDRVDPRNPYSDKVNEASIKKMYDLDDMRRQG